MDRLFPPADGSKTRREATVELTIEWPLGLEEVEMSDTEHESDFGERLISVCRTAVGDELRSITYFDDEEVVPVYLRSDLDRTADLVGFAEIERTGFDAAEKYEGTELGEYRATVRMFENGYLTRVVYDQTGVWVTTDIMSMERFEELSSALRPVLEVHVSDER